MLKRHEVEILLKAGHSKVEVTHLTGVSLRSVKRIAEEEPVVLVDELLGWFVCAGVVEHGQSNHETVP